MATLTTFGNFSERQQKMARLEDYSRAIAHLENSIERVKTNFQNGRDYINKLLADRENTQDPKELKQIEVDLKYLQSHFKEDEMNEKVNQLEIKLRNHRLRLSKLRAKHAAKKSPLSETA